jgi:hypothetical protein
MTMKIVLPCLLVMFCCLGEGSAEEDIPDGWEATVLWKSDVVSARLLVKRSASLADTKWIGLEFENHTAQPLEFGQTWIALNEIGLSGTMRSVKKLPTGRHCFYEDTFRFASETLGLPPMTGRHVEFEARVETALTDGRRFETPADAPSISFEWRYPSAKELAGMCQELKQLVAAHADLEINRFRIKALFKVLEVRDSLTLDVYLPAMKACTDYNVRCGLLPVVTDRFAEAGVGR